MDTAVHAESTHVEGPVNGQIAIAALWLTPFARIALESIRERNPALYVIVITNPLGDPTLLSPAWSRDRALELYSAYRLRSWAVGGNPADFAIATVHGGAPEFVRACRELTARQVSLALEDSDEIVHIDRDVADAFMRFIPAMDQKWVDCDPYSELVLAWHALREAAREVWA